MYLVFSTWYLGDFVKGICGSPPLLSPPPNSLVPYPKVTLGGGKPINVSSKFLFSKHKFDWTTLLY